MSVAPWRARLKQKWLVNNIVQRVGFTYASIVSAIFFFSTMTLTATHPLSSSEVTVGALRPGVMLLTFSNFDLGALYVQRTYF